VWNERSVELGLVAGEDVDCISHRVCGRRVLTRA
jgi:hypothetical protein